MRKHLRRVAASACLLVALPLSGAVAQENTEVDRLAQLVTRANAGANPVTDFLGGLGTLEGAQVDAAGIQDALARSGVSPESPLGQLLGGTTALSHQDGRVSLERSEPTTVPLGPNGVMQLGEQVGFDLQQGQVGDADTDPRLSGADAETPYSSLSGIEGVQVGQDADSLYALNEARLAEEDGQRVAHLQAGPPGLAPWQRLELRPELGEDEAGEPVDEQEADDESADPADLAAQDDEEGLPLPPGADEDEGGDESAGGEPGQGEPGDEELAPEDALPSDEPASDEPEGPPEDGDALGLTNALDGLSDGIEDGEAPEAPTGEQSEDAPAPEGPLGEDGEETSDSTDPQDTPAPFDPNDPPLPLGEQPDEQLPGEGFPGEQLPGEGFPGEGFPGDPSACPGGACPGGAGGPGQGEGGPLQDLLNDALGQAGGMPGDGGGMPGGGGGMPGGGGGMPGGGGGMPGGGGDLGGGGGGVPGDLGGGMPGDGGLGLPGSPGGTVGLPGGLPGTELPGTELPGDVAPIDTSTETGEEDEDGDEDDDDDDDEEDDDDEADEDEDEKSEEELERERRAILLQIADIIRTAFAQPVQQRPIYLRDRFELLLKATPDVHKELVFDYMERTITAAYRDVEVELLPRDPRTNRPFVDLRLG